MRRSDCTAIEGLLAEGRGTSSVRALGGDVGREGRGQFTGNPWDLRLPEVQ
jgi:hypothetical protein